MLYLSYSCVFRLLFQTVIKQTSFSATPDASLELIKLGAVWWPSG